MTEFRNGHPVKETGIPDGEYYTLSEFAEEFDIPEGTLRVWVHRGILLSENYYGRTYIPAHAEIMHKKHTIKV